MAAGRPRELTDSVPILEKILRAGEGRILRRLKAIADTVNSIEEDYVDLSDAELQRLSALLGVPAEELRANAAESEAAAEGEAPGDGA